MSKLWGGRFAKETDELVHQFNASLPFDRRLYDEDITASVAWARGLVGAGILTSEEASIIVNGLEKVRTEFQSETFAFARGDEDIHTAVERRLIELVGPVGGKLHTGRSRNDQVSTDFRLWMMRAVDEITNALGRLQQALVGSAENNLLLPLPGYTHLQHAQPVTWGQWVLSHFWPLSRDQERWQNVYDSAAVLPLGAAALAGTAYAVDRQALAQELGFNEISSNSMDAVADRDFVVDFLYAAALLSVHLSRLAEQLIIYSSSEFGFIHLDDAYATGSSLMPQKKNPDTLELTRGKAGRFIGHLTGFLVTLKGLPSTYDKDLQEDKEPVFDAFDNLMLILPVMTGVIETLQLRPDRMMEQLDPAMMATDLADYLVKRGVPFRQAHEIVGEAVRFAEEAGKDLDQLTFADLQRISTHFGADVGDVFNLEAVLAVRQVPGGVSGEALIAQLQKAKRLIE